MDYDIIQKETQAAYKLLYRGPFRKQAGYHITNIYLTPRQKVFRTEEGAVPELLADPLPTAVDMQNNESPSACKSQ